MSKFLHCKAVQRISQYSLNNSQQSLSSIRNSLPCFSISRTYSTEETPLQNKRVTFKDKFREAWNGPNFKYWFLGTTVFVSWMSYYGWQSYKKGRIDVELPPSLPNHVVVDRQVETATLHKKIEAQYSYFGASDNVTKLLVLGNPGSGKTVLLNKFVKSLLEKQEGLQVSLPKSHVSAFLYGDNEANFLLSLKGLASKIKIKNTDLDARMEDFSITGPFKATSFTNQCDVLLACIQEALKKHAGWILVIDNLQSNTPQSVVDVVNRWFKGAEWSKGTLLMASCDTKTQAFDVTKEQTVYMPKGMSMADAYHLLQNMIGLDKELPVSASFKQIIGQVKGVPLSLTCLGILIRDKLSSKEVKSIEDVIQELLTEINTKCIAALQQNTTLATYVGPTFEALLTTQVLIAMVLDKTLAENPYLCHGFDFIVSLKPGTVLPQSVLNRHLSDPHYKLPALTTASYGLSDVFNRQKTVLDEQEKELQLDNEKAWSNKNLAEYVRKVKEFFSTIVETVTQVYELVYGTLPELPAKDDGLDMFRSCELLTTQTIQPGDVKGISMHPLVYNAARQHFISSTVPQTEAQHLNDSKNSYDRKSWYHKLQGFSEQTCLHKLRNSAADTKRIEDATAAESFLNRYNFGIDVSSVFAERNKNDRPESYWHPSASDRAAYLQAHLTRCISSLNDGAKLSKQTTAGNTTKKTLLFHLEYLLQTQSVDTLGQKAHFVALSTVADSAATLNNDFENSKTALKKILEMQESSMANPLEIAKTLTSIAKIHQSMSDFEEARLLLERAAELHEVERKRAGEYKQPTDYGRLLGLLGVTYGALDLKQKSKETIERSLMLMQAAPPDLADEAKSKSYGAEFASALTDLGHSYILIGLPLYGKKILDLAVAALKNIHGTENHPEIVRATTLLGVAHLMQGNNDESRRLRKEAAKIQAEINVLPFY